MPTVAIDNATRLSYFEDCFAEPWGQPPEVVLMVHGVAESSKAWFAWVPHLVRHYRVIRMDLRGMGGSTVPPAGHEFSPEGFADDIAKFMDALKIARAHIVGAKVGAAGTLAFGYLHPRRAITITALSPLIRSATPGTFNINNQEADLAARGLRNWAAQTMASRLGVDADPAQVAWWTDMFCETDPGVLRGVLRAAKSVDLTSHLPAIPVPTLLMVSEESRLQNLEDMRQFARLIPHGEIATLPGDGLHLAATRPDECAEIVLSFIRRHGLQ